MKHITPFTSLNDSCPEREILDLVFNKCAELLRTGGGPLQRSVGFSGQTLPDNVRREMRRRVAKGDEPRDVADTIGVHYQTVMSNTRDIRTARKVVATAATGQEVAA